MVQLSIDMALPGEHNDTGLAADVLAEARRRSLDEYLLSEPLVLGVSGGADSLAMLHLLVALRGETARSTLHVAHLNHWFRGKEAKEDAEFVRSTASAWGLSCTVESFDVPNYARRNKLSSEDAARRARYMFLASIAHEGGAAVAVAHNADDQVETVLMSILRGTGMGGLAGMRMLSSVPLPPEDESIATFASVPKGTRVPLFRPLLHVWRHQVLAYCKRERLEPRFDSTNWERTYRRNRVRHDLIPLLQMQYSLAVKDHLYNLSQIAEADNTLIESAVDEEWSRSAIISAAGDEVRFDRHHFTRLSEAMRRRLVRRAFATVAGTIQDYTFEHIEVAIAIISLQPDAPRARHLPHRVVVRREDGWGVVALHDGAEHTPMPGVEHYDWPVGAIGIEVSLPLGQELSLEAGWRFRADVVEAEHVREKAGELVAHFDYEVLAVSGRAVLHTRRPGDVIQPLGMDGHKSLQDLMVDAKIPRELRDRIPIVALEGGDQILWVPGRGGRRSCHAPLTEATKRVVQFRFWLDSNEGKE